MIKPQNKYIFLEENEFVNDSTLIQTQGFRYQVSAVCEDSTYRIGQNVILDKSLFQIVSLKGREYWVGKEENIQAIYE